MTVLYCSVCGGPAQDDPAFAHTEDCRIGRRIMNVRKTSEFVDLLERSSLGTPGAKALRKIGQLCLQGKSQAEIDAALTPEEHAAANAEMKFLEEDLRRLT